MKEDIIGIDLGTSNSEVAVFVDDKIEIVEENGNALVPSYVGLDQAGNIVVGLEARNQYVLYPEQTIRSIKRKMGTAEKSRLGDQEYLPQEISALILKKLKLMAEKRLGREVHKAVITVPAQFNDAQRQATREAGAIAGLEVVRIINEPTAACLAYEQAADKKASRILAFDLGGGTFDVSVVTVEDDIVEVISSHGDNQLGGDDMDDLIQAWILKQIYAGQQSPAMVTELAQLRLKRTAETTKKQFSEFTHAKIIEDNIETGAKTQESINTELSRLEFNTMIQPLLDKMLLAVHEALADAHLKAADIDEIILVGGATRVPVILEIIEQEFGKRPRRDIHPDLAVAYGAGIMAARLMGKQEQRILVDITPYTFGTSCMGYVKGEYVPYFYSPVLKAGTPLPALKSESYYTMVDMQEKVEVKVFQGENIDARQNILVGEFLIEGLSKVPAGNEIILNMRLDLDGILRVTAREKITNLQKDITIEGALKRMTDEQLQQSKKSINKLFGDININAGEQTETDEQPEQETDRLDRLLDKITAKVERSLDKMDDLDRKDSAALLDGLKAAAVTGDKLQFDKLHTELKDLLFYLETE